MVTKLSRSARCAVPEHYHGQSGTLAVNEHSGTVWLWAFPELLLWDEDLVWLFSPVTGNARWPGDLWGLDRLGRLLIVENKLSGHKKRKCDPFEDFVSFDGISGELFKVTALTKHWECLYKQEMDYVRRNGRPQLDVTMPGVLPYSSKCRDLFRWMGLYRELNNLFETGDYEKTVREYLAARSELNNTDKLFPPHYFGVMTVNHDKEPALTDDGKTNLGKLDSHMPGHIHLVSLKATTDDGQTAVIKAQELSASTT